MGMTVVRGMMSWTAPHCRRMSLSGELFGTPQCPVARILAPVLTVLGASILVCDLFESPWREVLAFAALAAACFPWDTGLIRSTR